MIHFSYHIQKFRLRNTGKIKRWIIHCIEKEKRKPGTIYIHWVDEKEMLFLNQKYLNHNTHTDIITFDYSEKNVINGELFICIDRVKENAVKFENNNFRKESLRVIIHGILHLCGYKDKKAKDKKIMKQKEDDYLNIFESMN